MAEKKWSTVSIPRAIRNTIDELIEEIGYWPSVSAFIREAALEKLRRERIALSRFVPESIVFVDDEAKRRSKKE